MMADHDDICLHIGISQQPVLTGGFEIAGQQ